MFDPEEIARTISEAWRIVREFERYRTHPTSGRCSECGVPLPSGRGTPYTCSPACRQRRSRRLRAQSGPPETP